MTAVPERGRADSRRPLLVVALAFLALFFWLRSRSTFLRIEGQRAAAEQLAADHRGIGPADALALRDFVGVDAERDVWQ